MNFRKQINKRPEPYANVLLRKSVVRITITPEKSDDAGWFLFAVREEDSP